MVRKELKLEQTYGYNYHDANAVMDAQEQRIKKCGITIRVLQIKIKELEANQPKWISFYDKVPALYQNILVNVPGANKENRMEPTRSIFWCPAREEELKVGLLYYTHWIPLPNPPTEETK